MSKIIDIKQGSFCSALCCDECKWFIHPKYRFTSCDEHLQNHPICPDCGGELKNEVGKYEYEVHQKGICFFKSIFQVFTKFHKKKNGPIPPPTTEIIGIGECKDPVDNLVFEQFKKGKTK